MRSHSRFVSILLLILLANFLNLNKIFAASNFKTSYNVLYEISNNSTQVVQKIKLTNQKTNYYASEFETSLGKINVENIKAFENNEPLVVKTEKKGDETFVKVFFSEKVVGLGKSHDWILYFDSNDILQINGAIKEIDIPRLKIDNDIDEYNLNIKVPQSFGQPLFIKPVYKTSLNFTKDDLTRGQISISYGEKQILTYNLKYHIRNTKVVPVTYEIALPPDTPYQKVYLNSIIPKPDNIVADRDGNWLAQYLLIPGSTKDITATGAAELYLTPKNEDNVSLNISDFNSQLLNSLKYWDVSNIEIQEIAKSKKTPRDIYDYVVSKLKYDYNKVANSPTRIGAINALNNPNSSICTEFTDLFITLSRAANIPAREINGYALTNNPKIKPLSLQKDVLHSWPEYFDSEKKQWIQVDPTWGNTTDGIDFFDTFDVNHFAFVRRGQNSEFPIPAGAYKLDNSRDKDVIVGYGSEADIDNSENISLKINSDEEIYSGLQHEGTLTIENIGKSAIKFEEISVNVTGGDLLNIDKSKTPLVIPPFGKTSLKFTYKSSSLYTSGDILISAHFGKYDTSKTVHTKRFGAVYFIPIFILLLICTIATLIYYIYRWKKSK